MCFCCWCYSEHGFRALLHGVGRLCPNVCLSKKSRRIFLPEHLLQFKLETNKELLKRRLHELLLQIPFFHPWLVWLWGHLSVTACRKVTGLRSVRPEVKSAPVHPCLKCCLQAASSPCVFLPCHVPCSWGVSVGAAVVLCTMPWI